MDLAETKFFMDEPDVHNRLAALELTYDGLMFAADAALAAASNATLYHPANAAGILAYQEGTWGLRQSFVGDRWVVDRQDSVEAIRNDRIMAKLVYCNVDLARKRDNPPNPRSRKGAGSERAANGSLFDQLPHYSATPNERYATYFLMVDVSGASELSRPVIKDGFFESFVERIWLSEGGDQFDVETLLGNEDDVADGFNPQVIRK